MENNIKPRKILYVFSKLLKITISQINDWFNFLRKIKVFVEMVLLDLEIGAGLPVEKLLTDKKY